MNIGAVSMASNGNRTSDPVPLVTGRATPISDEYLAGPWLFESAERAGRGAAMRFRVGSRTIFFWQPNAGRA